MNRAYALHMVPNIQIDAMAKGYRAADIANAFDDNIVITRVLIAFNEKHTALHGAGSMCTSAVYLP